MTTERPSLFPVKRAIIDRTLAELQQQPDNFGLNSAENEIMGSKRVGITMTLLQVALTDAAFVKSQDELHGDVNQLLEGALWMHKVLRIQAEENGMELQEASMDMADLFYENMDDYPNQESLDSWAKKLADDGVSEIDLDTLSANRPLRRLAAVVTYRIIRGLEDGRKLSQSL